VAARESNTSQNKVGARRCQCRRGKGCLYQARGSVQEDAR